MSTHPYNDDKRLLELLERWQTGNFSRADEQELSALAADDEFRRETLEGFWSLPEADHRAHLASIMARLQQRRRFALRVSFVRVLSAVAAIGILVLAVVWLLPNAEKSSPIAQEAVQTPVENQPVVAAPSNKDMTARESQPINLPESELQGKTAPDRKQSAPNAGAGPAPGSASSDFADSALSVESAEEVAVEDKAVKIVAAKPADNEGEYAKVAEKDDVVESPGNAATRSETMQDRAKAKSAPKKSAPPAPVSESNSTPVGGWNKFRNYLRDNARLTEAARQHNVSDTLKLRFRLDENNQPVDFQILHSLGYGCDEEAIRLVKAYSWQRGSNPELTLDVPFVR